jgi:single-strand DNA-binding protein
VNVFVVSGRLGQKPMLKRFPSGSQVCEFSLAHTRRMKPKNEGEPDKETDWFECEVWDRLAEILSAEASKGQVITVTGELALEKYTSTAASGATILKPSIKVHSFELGRMPSEKGAR